MTKNPLNQCGACGEDFTSVAGFDMHRVGTFDYTFSQGLDMDPPREDGRRCLGSDEIQAKGFERDEHGRWWNPAKAALTRARFASSQLSREPI